MSAACGVFAELYVLLVQSMYIGNASDMIRVRADYPALKRGTSDLMEYESTGRRRGLSAELSGNVTRKYRIATLDRAKPITCFHKG